jgi:DNA-binding ferritin-like protein
MKKIILKSLQIQSQMRILHWQTTSYAEHKAFGKFYDRIDNHIDSLIETVQGKYGRIMLGGIDSIQLSDYSNLKLNVFIMDMEAFFCAEIYNCGINPSKDAEIDNILQEIRAEIDKLKYLLTLK